MVIFMVTADHKHMTRNQAVHCRPIMLPWITQRNEAVTHCAARVHQQWPFYDGALLSFWQHITVAKRHQRRCVDVDRSVRRSAGLKVSAALSVDRLVHPEVSLFSLAEQCFVLNQAVTPRGSLSKVHLWKGRFRGIFVVSILIERYTMRKMTSLTKCEAIVVQHA
ncbi:hypothetical protein CL655_03610 [bacterium]|nr:hypothetical protein [bacterium]